MKKCLATSSTALTTTTATCTRSFHHPIIVAAVFRRRPRIILPSATAATSASTCAVLRLASTPFLWMMPDAVASLHSPLRRQQWQRLYCDLSCQNKLLKSSPITTTTTAISAWKTTSTAVQSFSVTSNHQQKRNPRRTNVGSHKLHFDLRQAQQLLQLPNQHWTAREGEHAVQILQSLSQLRYDKGSLEASVVRILLDLLERLVQETASTVFTC